MYMGQNDTFFHDIEGKEGGFVGCSVEYNSSIIIGGSSFTNQKNYPSVLRIDTLGNIIWDTAVSDTSIYSALNYQTYIYKLINGNNGYLYALFRFSSNQTEVWKVNVGNGSISWKKKYNYVIRHLINYDAGKMLFSLFSTTSGTRIALVYKNNFDTLYTKYMGYNPEMPIALDTAKNIYTGKLDSLYKFSATFPHQLIWSNKYSGNQVRVKKYEAIHCDSLTNELFYIGVGLNSTGKIHKVNPVTGSMISFVICQTECDVEIQDIKSQNSFLYLTWRHIYFGSGSYPWAISKYNKSSGTLNWSKTYNFTNNQVSQTSSAMSIDIDNNGNVYGSGYYGGQSYGPGYWGILKLDGSNGNVMYEKTFLADSILNNNASAGKGVHIINNTPCFVGELETYHRTWYQRSKVALVKIDPGSGNTTYKKLIGGTFKFPSRVLSIENYSNQTLVLKQCGRYIELEMYSFSKNLLWNKKISKDYYLFGSNLSVSANGNIHISGYTKEISSSFPYHGSITDSIWLFKLDNMGNILNESSFYIGANDVVPTNLQADNNSAILFYHKNYNKIYYRGYNGLGFSSEVDAQINHVYLNPLVSPSSTNITLSSNYCHYTNTPKAYLFGKDQSSSCKYIEIDKTTFAATTLTNIPTNKIMFVNSIKQLFSDGIILCGSDINNRGSIALFNTTIQDTIWVKRIGGGGYTQALKCDFNPSRSSLYTISSDSGNIVVRKIKSLNGNVTWRYSYNGNLNGNEQDFATDIFYDTLKHQLLITGFKTINNIKQGLILKLDTNGYALDTIIKTGNFTGNNEAICIKMIADGSQWAGGYINNNPETGFISEIGQNVFDQVWPGDANSDGIVNNIDALELGLHYTHAGPARATVSNSWQSHIAFNWTGTISNGKNMNHSDCNGDGIINDNDTLAIYNNYGLTHVFKPTQTNTVTSQLRIIPNQESVANGTWGTASIYLGDVITSINNINGIAFTVDFDNSLIEANNIYIQYQNSFLDAGQNLRFRKLDFSNGKIYTATTHTISNNVSGNGLIAKLHYQVKSNLTSDQVLNIGLSQANQSNASGVITPLTSGTATLMVLGASVGLQDLNEGYVSISPNPTNGALTIYSKTELQKIEVISITGQVLLSEVPTNVSHTLYLDNFADGIYYINVYHKDRIVKREKVVLNK